MSCFCYDDSICEITDLFHKEFNLITHFGDLLDKSRFARFIFLQLLLKVDYFYLVADHVSKHLSVRQKRRERRRRRIFVECRIFGHVYAWANVFSNADISADMPTEEIKNLKILHVLNVQITFLFIKSQNIFLQVYLKT